MNRRNLLLTGLSGLGVAALVATGRRPRAEASHAFPLVRSDAEWRQMLTPAQYQILREHGTERPGTSPLNHETRAGRFDCVGCNQPLFTSKTKFDSHTGWPSFWDKLPNGVATEEDRSYGMIRTEVHCSNCGSHQGHLFDDGPQPTGLRYCMNGVGLTFHPDAA